MKQLRQARRMTTGALMVSALCAHLLIAGLCTTAPPFEIGASPETSVARVTTSPPRDVLAARNHTASLSLHTNARRTDSFAAALVSPLARLTFAPTRARIVYPTTAKRSASLLPAASRAPPSLVA
ncbi:MAG: hypothetical protein ACJ74J_01660 [Blastocatellia bacterium]